MKDFNVSLCYKTPLRRNEARNLSFKFSIFHGIVVEFIFAIDTKNKVTFYNSIMHYVVFKL